MKLEQKTVIDGAAAGSGVTVTMLSDHLHIIVLVLTIALLATRVWLNWQEIKSGKKRD